MSGLRTRMLFCLVLLLLALSGGVPAANLAGDGEPTVWAAPAEDLSARTGPAALPPAPPPGKALPSRIAPALLVPAGPKHVMAIPTTAPVTLSMGVRLRSTPWEESPDQTEFYPEQQLAVTIWPERYSDPAQEIAFVLTASYPTQVNFLDGSIAMGQYMTSCDHNTEDRVITCNGTFPPANPPVWRQSELVFGIQITCKVYDKSMEELRFPAKVEYSDGLTSTNTAEAPLGVPFELRASNHYFVPNYTSLIYTVPKDDVPDTCTACPLDTYIVVNNDTDDRHKMDNNGEGLTDASKADFIAADCHQSAWFKPTEIRTAYNLDLYLVSKDKPFEDARRSDEYVQLFYEAEPQLIALSDLRELYQEFDLIEKGTPKADDNANNISDYYDALERVKDYAKAYKGLVLDVRQDAPNYAGKDFYAGFSTRKEMGQGIDQMMSGLRSYKTLRYLAIIGDDAVVPFYRPPAVGGGLATAFKEYKFPINNGGTNSGNPTFEDYAALPGGGSSGNLMSDLPYSDLRPGLQSRPNPHLATGRVFSARPLELISVIEAYEQNLPLNHNNIVAYVSNADDDEVPFNYATYEGVVKELTAYFSGPHSIPLGSRPSKSKIEFERGNFYWLDGDTVRDWKDPDWRWAAVRSELMVNLAHGNHRETEGATGSITWERLAKAGDRAELMVVGSCHAGVTMARQQRDAVGLKSSLWRSCLAVRAMDYGITYIAQTTYDRGTGRWFKCLKNHDLQRLAFFETLTQPQARTIGEVFRRTFYRYRGLLSTFYMNSDLTTQRSFIMYGLPTRVVDRAAPRPLSAVSPAGLEGNLHLAEAISLSGHFAAPVFERVDELNGESYLQTPYHGRLDGIEDWPLVPVAVHSYLLPAGATNVTVTLTAVQTQSYTLPITLGRVTLMNRSLGELPTRTRPLTQTYPATILGSETFTTSEETMVYVLGSFVQVEPDGTITLFERIDYNLSYQVSTPTVEIQGAVVDDDNVVPVEQAGRPIRVTLAATGDFSGTLDWSVEDAAGALRMVEEGQIALVSGTALLTLTLDTLDWAPGPLLLHLQLVAGRTLSESGVVLASYSRPFSASGYGLELSTDRDVYAIEEGTAGVSAIVRDEHGQRVSGLAGDLESWLDGGSLALAWSETAGTAYSATLSLGGLDAGGHVLLVTVAGAAPGWTLLAVDQDPPTSTLGSPAEVYTPSITVAITGGDDVSGIDYYELQYRVGGGAWTDWLTRSTEWNYELGLPADLSPQFGEGSPITLTPEMTYCFRVWAVDGVGHEEAVHDQADSCTLYTRHWESYLPLLAKNWPPFDPFLLELEPVGQANGPIYEIEVQGQYAYLAEGNTLSVMDVSNPANPQRVGYAFLPYKANDVAVSGNYAYVTVNSTGGLRVIDVSDPRNPVEVGYYELYMYSLGVDVVGDYAYVINAAPGVRGLQVFDVSDPSNPTWMGYEATSPYAWNLHVVGDYAYVADGPEGVRVISVADPAHPTTVGQYTGHGSTDVYVQGNHAYVAADSEGFYVLSVADPANPAWMGGDASYWANGVHADGAYAYLADDDGLFVLSLADPANPTLVGAAQGWPATNLYVAGGHAYVINGDVFAYGGHLRVISLADPASPTWVGTRWALLDLERIQVLGAYAYAVDGELGLAAFSLADPQNPTLISVYGQPLNARDLHVADGYAYVVDNEQVSPVDVIGRVWIVSVADPYNPVEVGVYETDGSVSCVHVAGDLAYVLRYDSLQVVSIADRANPVQVGSLPGLEQPKGLDVAADYVYVADNVQIPGDVVGELKIVSVVDPLHPVQVAISRTRANAWDVHVRDNYAYVADDFEGMGIVLVSDPANPVPVGHYDAPGQTTHVYADPPYAYLATGMSGLHAVWFEDPANPLFLDDYDAYAVTDVYADEEYIYTADRGNGLILLQLELAP